ncbi:MAG: type 2 isopentenyl-diphosphate Delta-isomerase [Thaumarchaeota archaeon]|jgi:isopentenyl-diphosphate delta-isomerase|nr:type 2 isopentenyl-diphosphate Delta-isomerase [Candidatus Geocrenenecus arthurdayi]MCL7390445.1 type 2 isopentenyl-diphosphate Delta-isomerase [Candidatus Geocrenenecus arthurdayi]MCL7396098.1 type 2 isopentenyl-diphosphate Delta-isomerase [Candidatus Geocrenenecus arthurdayi]MCL7402770.1 type 2 isopentenyl-diphosphate Delta-isomerase [Candidatus Geocrenenecus arthurdayi]
MVGELSSRKRDHIRICTERDVEFKKKTTWFEYVELIHNPLPEVDFNEIKLEASFLSRTFNYPLVIEGMTGGIPEAYKINKNLAEAALQLNIPLGVGSQRAGIRNESLKETYRIVRDISPSIFVIGNIGAVQLMKEGIELAEKAVEMIEANALAIHLNSLQELIQPGGATTYRGIIKSIEKTVNRLSVPVIVKEVGCGISRESAKSLEKIGVKVIDVAGAGGTNWTLIEKIRAEEAGDLEKKMLGEVFLEWGIPTAASIIEVSSTVEIEVIGSGGIRTGLDAAKALALGADMVGIAKPLLKPALESVESILSYLRKIILELRTAMYLTGCRNISELKKVNKVLTGPLIEWCRQRNLPV